MSTAELLGEGFWANQPTLGLVDGDIALQWVRFDDPSPTSDAPEYLAWFDSSDSLIVGPTRLGYAQPRFRSALARVGSELVAHLWIDPEGRPAGEAADNVGLWRFAVDAPGGVVGRTGIDLPLSRRRACTRCSLTSPWMQASLSIGSQGLMPVVGLNSGVPLAVVLAVPDGCPGIAVQTLRLMAFDERGRAATVHWTDDACAEQSGPNTPNALLLDDGSIGVLFRVRYRLSSRVNYLRMSPEFEILAGPWLIGRADWEHAEVMAGYQPKVVTVGGGRLLFTERIGDTSYNSCVLLRVVSQEGPIVEEARDAPWQLPCFREPRLYHTAWHELVALPDGRAAIVWGQRSALGGSTSAYVTRVTSDVAWEEAIYLTMLNDDGSRASEVIRVTDEGATTLSPFIPRTAASGPQPAEFSLSVAAEGEDVVVIWNDSRIDRGGAYASRLRCTAP